MLFQHYFFVPCPVVYPWAACPMDMPVAENIARCDSCIEFYTLRQQKKQQCRERIPAIFDGRSSSFWSPLPPSASFTQRRPPCNFKRHFETVGDTPNFRNIFQSAMKTDAVVSVNGIIHNITLRTSEVVSFERCMQTDTDREFPETFLRNESRWFRAPAIRYVAGSQQKENHALEISIHLCLNDLTQE